MAVVLATVHRAANTDDTDGAARRPATAGRCERVAALAPGVARRDAGLVGASSSDVHRLAGGLQDRQP